MRDYFGKYYMPFAETKDFNALIDNKPFFDKPRKSIWKTCRKKYKKIIEMSRNNDYTTGNLLDFSYYQTIFHIIKLL